MQWNNNYKLHTHNHYSYSVQGMRKKKNLEEYCIIKVVTKKNQETGYMAIKWTWVRHTIKWSGCFLKKLWKKWVLTIDGYLSFNLAFKLSLSLYWLMVNPLATSPPKWASAKGTHYLLICFSCAQRGYIPFYNKLKARVQVKESRYVVQPQKFHTCSLPMTACCFVGQLHRSAPTSWRFWRNMKMHLGSK